MNLKLYKDEIAEGLLQTPKQLAPKFLYDDVGCELFEKICELPEYYVTRTELALLEKHVAEIGRRVGRRCRVYEFGSGSSVKTTLLLNALPEAAAYFPIDISSTSLEAGRERVRAESPNMPVYPICADFMDELPLVGPANPTQPGQNLVFFPGSTIGNFDEHEALSLLMRTASWLGAGGRLLIGVDLVKDVETLEAAYNDREGVTAAFNLNLIDRLNRELGMGLRREDFSHLAYFNRERSRIEMHLFSRIPQLGQLEDQQILFGAFESMHTESSYKYDADAFLKLTRRAGFAPSLSFIDEKTPFGIFLLETSSAAQPASLVA